MKKTLTVLISILIVMSLLIACSSKKQENVDALTSSINTLSENANKNDISTLNENTQNVETSNNDISTVSENTDKNDTNTLNKNVKNAEYKEKFLKSKEGHDFQVVSWKFTKAYLSGDISTMKNYIINPEDKDNYYNSKNRFNDVEFLILKLAPNDIKEDEIIAEYEFCLKGNDCYEYLNLEMKKVDGKWKVQFYGLQQ